MPARFSMTLIAFVLMTLSSFVRADFDIRPYVGDGRVMTGGYDDGTSEFIANLRVFQYAFQEEVEDPYFTSDPGFNATTASGLPGGSQMRFNILSGSTFSLPSNLTYWDGTDADPSTPGIQVSFGLVPDDESINFSFGSSNVAVSNLPGSPDQAGFVLQTVTASGAMHRHLGATLNAGSGLPLPTDGIYLLAMELVNSSPSVAKSDPFFILYNNGLSDDQAALAYDYVTNHVAVPEASSLIMAALGGASFVGMWVRSRRVNAQ